MLHQTTTHTQNFQLPLHLPHKIQLLCSELMMGPLCTIAGSCPVVVVSSLVDQFFWSRIKGELQVEIIPPFFLSHQGFQTINFHVQEEVQVWHNPSLTKSFIIVNPRKYNKQIIYPGKILIFYSAIFLFPCKMPTSATTCYRIIIAIPLQRAGIKWWEKLQVSFYNSCKNGVI
jgi:hypothetical protein